MDKLTTITNSGRKKITLCPSSRVLAEGQDKRKVPSEYWRAKLQIGDPVPISYFGKERDPPPLPRQFSVEGKTSNALTREFNQLDERTHSSTTKRESALGSPLKSPTTNDQIQARDTSEESSELRQQLRFVGPGNAIFPGLSIEIYLRRPENFHLFPSPKVLC